VQLFGQLLAETILAPVPHRHFTFTIPKMLRPYFRFHRGLIKELCRIAHACLAEFQRATLGLPEGITGVVMAIHIPRLRDEYLDFHPHLHALAADGLFVDSGLFHVMPQGSLAPPQELFRARVITFLVKEGLLPPERAQMLRSWMHSGFNIHRSQRVPPSHHEDMERLAQYIVRNPFSAEKMPPNASGNSIIYSSGMNPMMGRNFEVLSPCDFIARITQHIPDKSFQLVRYYGWYSNPAGAGRGQRLKRAEPEGGAEVIDVSGPKPRRIPSKKWRELIKKVWEADPLLCPHCQNEMRIVALIDDEAVIERIPRHLGLWEAGVRVESARAPPEPDEPILEPWLDDPFPDYDHEPVFAQN